MSRRAGRLLDVARDGYYDSAKCIEDFEKVYWIFLVKNNNAPCKNQAMDFVEIAFGGKYKPIFLLDHSPIHKYGLESFLREFKWKIFRAMAEDALNAKTMNVKCKQIGDIFCSWCLQMGVSRTCRGTDFIALDPWKWPNTWSTRWRSNFFLRNWNQNQI